MAKPARRSPKTYDRDRLGMVKDGLERISAGLQMRAVSEENLEVEFIISNYSMDDYGTRFDPKGCDIEQFRRNPVISYRHMRDGGIYTLPIGRGLVGKDGDPDTFYEDDHGNLRLTVRFTPENVFPFGYQVYKLIKAGYLNMGSIGANSIRDEVITEKDGRRTVVFREWELFEFSVVPLGSNNDALVTQRAKDMNVEKSEILLREKEISDLADKDAVDEDQLVEVADALREGDEDEDEEEVTAEVIEDTEHRERVVHVRIKTTEGDKTIERVYKNVIVIPESADQVKHREYFEKTKDMLGAYRSMMDKAYKFLRIKKVDDERQAVDGLTKLFSASTVPTNRSSRPVPMSAQDVRTLTTKLVVAAVARTKEALLSGAPVRDIDQIVEEEIEKSFTSTSNQ